MVRNKKVASEVCVWVGKGTPVCKWTQFESLRVKGDIEWRAIIMRRDEIVGLRRVCLQRIKHLFQNKALFQ